MSAGNYSPRSSHDSDDSLRALELTEGPSGYSVAPTNPRTRSYSVSGFKFEPDLFQLSSTLDDPGNEGSGELGEKKQIGFAKGVALCVGLQVRIRAHIFRPFNPKHQNSHSRLGLVYCMRSVIPPHTRRLTQIVQLFPGDCGRKYPKCRSKSGCLGRGWCTSMDGSQQLR